MISAMLYKNSHPRWRRESNVFGVPNWDRVSLSFLFTARLAAGPKESD